LALGEPVFVGIARTDELSSYLGDVAHAKVTDFEYEPFEASYDRRGGKGKPDVPPGSGSFFGSVDAGRRPSDSHVGRRGRGLVDRRHERRRVCRRAGRRQCWAKGPFLTEIGWTVIGRGAILLAAAALVCSALARRNRPRATQPSLALSAS